MVYKIFFPVDGPVGQNPHHVRVSVKIQSHLLVVTDGNSI